jgi:hypothetical protein
MKLFPNPTNGLITFDMDENITISHAAVVNVHGQLVKEWTLNDNMATLDVSALAKGLYFLRLTGTDGSNYVKSYLMQ